MDPLESEEADCLDPMESEADCLDHLESKADCLDPLESEADCLDPLGFYQLSFFQQTPWSAYVILERTHALNPILRLCNQGFQNQQLSISLPKNGNFAHSSSESHALPSALNMQDDNL